MSKLFITRGLPGSGKTTWAETHFAAASNTSIVNRDDIREGLGGFNRKREKRVRELRDTLIRNALVAGLDVVSTDTNLVPSTFEHLRRLGEELGAEVVVKDAFLQVPVKECIRRDLLRERSVGKDIILRMYYEWCETLPKPENAGPRDAIICDIDGTLAHLPEGMYYPAAHDRDFSLDEVDPAVRLLLQAMRSQGKDIIFVSGRKQEQRDVTEVWLAGLNISYEALFTRAEGDDRDDAEVKHDLYMEHIQGKYRILYVIDDRPRVIRMWRGRLGLKVFDVGNGIEF